QTLPSAEEERRAAGWLTVDSVLRKKFQCALSRPSRKLSAPGYFTYDSQRCPCSWAMIESAWLAPRNRVVGEGGYVPTILPRLRIPWTFREPYRLVVSGSV